MRAASKTWAAAVPRGHASRIEVTSWLGARQLAMLPVVAGSWQVTESVDSQSGGGLSFDVPNRPEWRPVRPDSALAQNGQRLRVRIGQQRGQAVEWLSAGVFPVVSALPNDDVVHVEADGLLASVAKQQLIEPLVVRGQTRGWTVQRLLQGIAPVQVLLVDEPMGSWVCEKERLDGIREVVDGWPARLQVTDVGVVQVLPAFDDDSPGSPAAVISDGPGGTLLGMQLADATPNRFNGYRVSTVPEGDAEPVSETWVIQTGPLRWGGPYGYRPGFLESPTLPADRKKLRAVAKAMTMRAQRRADAYTFEAAPDARLRAGDVLRMVDRSQGLDFTGRLVEVSHRWDKTSGKVAFLGGAR